MRKTTFEVDGHKFVLKKNSRRNARVVAEYIDACQKAMEEVAKILERRISHPDEEIDPASVPYVADQHEMIFKVFCLITDGPHDLLDEEDFDAHVGEEAIGNFMLSGRTRLQPSIG
jgi:hypothetical protein